jgi:hypothetical protein
MSQASVPPSPQGLREQLFGAGYIADEDVASLVWMALSLERPMLIEGEAGVGKTAIAAACASALGRPLLRLQCYEGLAEEFARLKTHLQVVDTALAGKGPVGKRLDFLMQELNREANTLSSKSVSEECTQAALELKLLIEQMREQVQNLE